MQIPMSLNGPQADHLASLLRNGDPDLLILDSPVGGSPLLVVVARGAAREYAKARLFAGVAAEPAAPDAPVDQAPPVKVVSVRDGVNDARPAGR